MVAWQVYALTKDPLSLAWSGSRKRCLSLARRCTPDTSPTGTTERFASVAMAVQSVCGAALLVLTVNARRLLVGTVAPIFAIVSSSGLARSFLQPARTALGAEIVPRETYTNAITWRASLWQFAAVVGPAAAACYTDFPGRGSPTSSRSFCVGRSRAFREDHLRAPAVRRLPTLPSARTSPSGFGSCSRNPSCSAHSCSIFFRCCSAELWRCFRSSPPTSFTPGRRTWGSARRAGGRRGAGLGAAAASQTAQCGTRIVRRVAAFGLCWIFFAVSRCFWLSLALLLISGMVDNVSVVIRSTLLTLRTPPHLLGRVSSVNQIFIGSSNEIGSFESGVAAKLVGTVTVGDFRRARDAWRRWRPAWKIPALRELDQLS